MSACSLKLWLMLHMGSKNRLFRSYWVLRHVQEFNLNENFNVVLKAAQFLAIERPLKMMKNTFYFTSKAFVALKIFKVLS